MISSDMRGRTINIFIPDSNPRSVKICDIQDSIVKAIFIPRNKLDNVLSRSELLDPGVYFLFGNDSEIGKPEVYIGEAEVLITRIKQHNVNKDFWNTAICFVSEKKNINKAHIKYLESYACGQAVKINKCKLQNDVSPKLPSLTEQDIDFALNFFDDLKILIATLGYTIFEETKKEVQNLFICKGKSAYAEGEYSEDGMVVFKGARANSQEANGIQEWAHNLRQALLEQKIIRPDGDVLFFDEDYTFNSPSAAAAVILARSANGWTEWKDKEGITLDKRYRQEETLLSH